MRLISLRLLALCIILPPAAYILSLQAVEAYARHSYERTLAAGLIGDVQPLLEGRLTLEERIADNIRRFLQSRSLPHWGLQVRIRVATAGGQTLYPAPVNVDPLAFLPEDRTATAAENYRLMQETFAAEIDIRLPHNTLLANLLLAGYLAAALLIMACHYRRAMGRAQQEADRSSDFLRRMERLGHRHRKLLEALIAEKARLARDLNAMRGELDSSRRSADSNEAAMIDEIEALESQIAADEDQQRRQEEEIEALKEKLAAFEKVHTRASRGKQRSRQEVGRRLAALYKETRFHERAIAGFDDLPEELKLRCEETIAQLDRDADRVTIKRKVFSTSRQAFFEVVFAYRGRLYFRQHAGRGVEVVAIGTKNSQERDLSFLNTL